MLNICFVFFIPEKAHLFAEPRRLTYFCVKIGLGASAMGRWKNPQTKEAENIFDAQFRAYVENKLLEGS